LSHWIHLIEHHYPTSRKGGRPPYPLETMLRVHLMEQWYDLSDPAMEDAADQSGDDASLCWYRSDHRTARPTAWPP